MRQPVCGHRRPVDGDAGVSLRRSFMVQARRVAVCRARQPASQRLADRYRLPLATDRRHLANTTERPVTRAVATVAMATCHRCHYGDGGAADFDEGVDLDFGLQVLLTPPG